MAKHQINFPAIEMVTKVESGQTYVWDALRGRYLLLTPEEQVRRHVLAFLVSHCGVLPHSIAQEYSVKINGTAQRADIVVIGSDLRPAILVECKAPDVNIDKSTLAQAVRYNAVLGARYIILTNGHKHICAEFKEGQYTFLKSFPVMAYSTQGVEQ